MSKVTPKTIVLFLLCISILSTLVMIVTRKHKENDCLEQVVERSSKVLESKGYHETEDGSWRDEKGNLPSEDYDEDAEEERETIIYLECIN